MAATKIVGSAAKPAPKRKPPNAGKGRKPGVPNKTTSLLKEAILAAAKLRGEDGRGKGGLTGYCLWLARKQPKSFAALLGRVLPMQLTTDPDNPAEIIFRTVYEQRPAG
jgi:hypothetical protein